MKLKYFLESNHIRVDEKIISCYFRGMRYMKVSKDAHHSAKHIYRMMDDLDSFIRSGEIKKEEINWKILLTVIAWHDVWKTLKPLQTNIIKFIYGEYYHGIGGSRMFISETKDYKFKEEDSKIIGENIRHHSSFIGSVFPSLDRRLRKETLEYRIFRELDALDAWNIERLTDIQDNYIKKHFNPFLLVVVFFWYIIFTKRDSEENFSFVYTKKEFRERKDIMLRAIRKMWDDRRTIINAYEK